MQKRGFILFPLLVVVVIFCFIGLILISNKQFSSDGYTENQPIASSSPLTNKEFSNTTTKTYSSKEFHYSISFPSNWIGANTDKYLGDYKLIKVKKDTKYSRDDNAYYSIVFDFEQNGTVPVYLPIERWAKEAYKDVEVIVEKNKKKIGNKEAYVIQVPSIESFPPQTHYVVETGYSKRPYVIIRTQCMDIENYNDELRHNESDRKFYNKTQEEAKSIFTSLKFTN